MNAQERLDETRWRYEYALDRVRDARIVLSDAEVALRTAREEYDRAYEAQKWEERS